ncbi:MAG: Mrp/NBP35 family ATP-binding protein [Oscillospiraceae bacterium]|nr:Mrp/NBP35 family ATP-binding protein [Oscillospiraceae bacterium]MDY4104050.1 Mrp/NBP35 family ATP-binding protein [Oscillospiraceae bacterium]
MSECTHDCSSCGENCSSRDEIQKEKLHEGARVRKVIAVMSGKGGVGKSLVTSLLACEMQRRGFRTAVLDADMTGPSIPQAFGIHENAIGTDEFIYPNVAANGTQVMSMNILLQDETEPVVWRGPVIAGMVTQFWTDVLWDNVDYMFVDMPPGTGDVPLTVFQSLPVDAVVIVTSPQDLVSMIVEKAVKMTAMLNLPVIGVVENMAYFKCPDCGKVHQIFGTSGLNQVAAKYGIEIVERLPIDPSIAKAVDEGKVDTISGEYVSDLCDFIKIAL